MATSWASPSTARAISRALSRPSPERTEIAPLTSRPFRRCRPSATRQGRSRKLSCTLADWCSSKKLYAERDAVLERLLVFEPDHKKARKFLKRAIDALSDIQLEFETSDAPIQDRATAYCDRGVPAMEAVRKEVDALEQIVDDDLWPLPKYREMLFVH